MELGVRRLSEDCNSTIRRNAECTSETKPQGIAFIIGRTIIITYVNQHYTTNVTGYIVSWKVLGYKAIESRC